MQEFFIHTDENSYAIIPLIALLFKGAAAGAKHLGAKKALAKTAKHKVVRGKHRKKKRKKHRHDEEE
jgi:hypothetical protein